MKFHASNNSKSLQIYSAYLILTSSDPFMSNPNRRRPAIPQFLCLGQMPLSDYPAASAEKGLFDTTEFVTGTTTFRIGAKCKHTVKIIGDLLPISFWFAPPFLGVEAVYLTISEN
jgi:hypothetical protein